jgi:hypothetical protein
MRHIEARAVIAHADAGARVDTAAVTVHQTVVPLHNSLVEQARKAINTGISRWMPGDHVSMRLPGHIFAECLLERVSGQSLVNMARVRLKVLVALIKPTAR